MGRSTNIMIQIFRAKQSVEPGSASAISLNSVDDLSSRRRLAGGEVGIKTEAEVETTISRRRML